MANLATELKEENTSLKHKVSNLRKHAEAGVNSVVSGALAAGTGAALGLAAAYNEDKPGELQEVQGVPVSAIAGAIAHLLAISTKKSHMADHFRAVGNGALAVASFEYMKIKGKEWKEEDGAGGYSPMAKGRRMTSAVSETVGRLTSAERVHDAGSRLPVQVGEYRLDFLDSLYLP